MVSFDSALAIVIPVLLILLLVGFCWVKFFEPYAWPMLVRFWEWVKGKSEDAKQKRGGRELEFD